MVTEHEFFSSLGFPLQQSLLAAQNTRKWSSTCVTNNQMYTITLCEGLNPAQIQTLLTAFTAQYTLFQRHTAIVPIIAWDIYGQEGNSLYCIEEYMDKTLKRDISLRQKNRFHYESQDIWTFMWSLINLFADMQNLGLAHRYITLESLKYLNKTVKIADFQYCCPSNVQLNVLYDSNYSNSPQNLPIDVYKADVFALGLCFFACLELNTLELEDKLQNIVTYLSHITDTKVKSVLYYMLQGNPETRPDFISLQTYLSTFCELPGLKCPHFDPNFQSKAFNCHGSFCQNCVCYDLNEGNYVCPICGNRLKGTEGQVVATHGQVDSRVQEKDKLIDVDGEEREVNRQETEVKIPQSWCRRMCSFFRSK